MAKEFGGKYSPKGRPDNADDNLAVNKFRGRKVVQSNIRVNLLFLAPLPLFLTAIGEMRRGDTLAMTAELGALTVLLLAAWLLRDGLSAEAAYNDRKVARPPAIPRKILASALTGVGVAVAAYFGMGAGIGAVVYGLIAAAAHSFSFGIDPMSKKGMEGFNEFEADRVARAVDKAETLLSETVNASKRIGDRTLEGRVESLASAARDMFRTVEDDPRDLSSARKFLTVYLQGARDATAKFADIYSRKKDQSARAEYEALLTDLEASFTAQRETMLLSDRTDLDVEIEVLRDRLKQEGIRARK